jgi:hypothetical protein
MPQGKAVAMINAPRFEKTIQNPVLKSDRIASSKLLSLIPFSDRVFPQARSFFMGRLTS